jgi:DNA-binding HxlR family transcriptional regulator
MMRNHGWGGRPLLDILARKWSVLVIVALETRTLRFGELLRTLDGVSPKMLTRTLRRLEEVGIVDRTVLPQVPPHVEYTLTDLGRSAAEPLGALRIWVDEHRADPEADR